MHPAWRKFDALFFLSFFAYLLDVMLILGHPSHSIACWPDFPRSKKQAKNLFLGASPLPASFDLLSLSERDGEEQERKQSIYAWARTWGVVRLVRDLRGLCGVSGGKCAWKAQITCCFSFKGLFLFLS